VVTNHNRIYLSSPDVGEAEEEAVVRAVRSGWVAPLGPEVDAFESEVADFVGAGHGVALSSGTAALHLGLQALGVRPGDAVITSTMTFVATANAITYTGAHPVFVDSLSDGTPAPTHIEQAILDVQDGGGRVGAIIPVDIYGRCSDYSSILELGSRYSIPVLADSAEALGASYQGAKAGSLGDGAVLSFNGNKIMTTSGGGMFMTESEEAAKYVRYLATQAREPAIHYEHVELGYNYRLSSISAALGRAQLARLPEMIARRRAIRAHYGSFFADVAGVSLLPGNPDEDNCWLTSVLVSREEGGFGPLDLQEFLEERNIESRPLWKPMHLQPLYKDAGYVGGKVAEKLFETGLALPSGSVLTDADINRVLDAITDFLAQR
jgi:dTDP-4-amino-4,6-dideoxygalactose transaminase